MSELSFKVQGTDDQPLEVVFRKSGKNLTVTCSCLTGASGICQHQITILSGSTKGVVSENANEVKKVASWIAGTDVSKALRVVLDCAKTLENATDDFNAARKRLVAAMRD